ncbi:MAG: 50S ribosomal protein L9 [Paracoccaceae bacterium]
MEIILLERIKNLGQMGDRVSVKSGYARNFLFPLKKALRANEENIKRFENEKIKLEANNLETKKQAEKLHDKIKGKKFVLIRSASESGALYGSVTARDIQVIMQENNISISKSQIELNNTIKELGIVAVPISLHPELSVEIQIIVARSEEEALAQDNKNADIEEVSDQTALGTFFEKETDAPDYDSLQEIDPSNNEENAHMDGEGLAEVDNSNPN